MADDEMQPKFSVGELVRVIDPGWIWDGMQADVRSVDLPGAAARVQEPMYTVRIRWPQEQGGERLYYKWQHQLAPWADAAAQKGGGDGQQR